MAHRIVNFVIYNNHEKWGREENQKIIDMMLHTSFSDDLKFFMARQFLTPDAKKHSARLSNIVMHPQIVAMIVS